MRISIQFDRKWFFAQESHMMAVNKVVTLLRDEVDEQITVIEKSLNQCVLDIPSNKEPTEVSSRIRGLITEHVCHDSSDGQLFQVTILGEKVPAPETEPTAVTPEIVADDNVAQKESALDKVAKMIGVTDFKKLCQDIHARAARIRANGTQDVFLSTAYLFSGNEGYGCDKAISFLTELLEEEELFRPTADPYTIKVSPPEMYKGNIEHVICTPRVIKVDLTGAIGHTHVAEFKRLIIDLFRSGGKNVVVFRVPCLPKHQINEIVRDLNDILPVRTVLFPLFQEAELRALAEQELQSYHFRSDDAIWPLFSKKISQESMDGYFYGAHTVRKIVREMISAEETLRTENPIAGGDTCSITAEAMERILEPEETEPEKGLDELENMVGMKEIAKQVRELICMIQFAKSDPLTQAPCMHMCFTGNPGTGKTTVARIIGKTLREAGVLRVGKFFEHHARELCGQYIGHTAPITINICKEAYGSVLFLDEAYSLAPADDDRDFGHEAIDTLIAQMENHREDLLVVVAGYSDEMSRFLKANPGMMTRIPYHIHFRNYTRDELYEIFCGMIGKRFRAGEGFLDRLYEYFMSLPDELLESRSFGNGRFVRNLYERVCCKAVMRLSGAAQDLVTLEKEDIEAVIDEIPVSEKAKTVRVGF